MHGTLQDSRPRARSQLVLHVETQHPKTWPHNLATLSEVPTPGPAHLLGAGLQLASRRGAGSDHPFQQQPILCLELIHLHGGWYSVPAGPSV